MTRRIFLVSSLFGVVAVAIGSAQMLSGDALVQALRKGGYVIVMRHASSPREVPDKATANPDNTKPERQLDQEGRTTATAMGKALRDLKIPIGEVWSSPTYRALETVRLEGWTNPKPVPELGDNGRSMSGGTEAQAKWLRERAREIKPGTNVVIVTHLPNLTAAFAQEATGVGDGEALIFGPDAKIVARVKIDEWARLK